MSFKTLNIGVTALMTSQLALNTVGHNMANAATPGYTRQRLMTEANLPDYKTFGALGSGVDVNSVARVADEFLERQVREATSLNSYYSTKIDTYGNIEAVFNELTENDISTTLDEFWNAINDVNNHVEDVSTRRVLIEQAQVLADSFNAIDSKLFDMRQRLNDNIADQVQTVNSLLHEISTLNQDVIRAEYGGKSDVVANDSRDQRNERLKELSGLLDITVTHESNGAVGVSLKGRLLIYDNVVFELGTEQVVSDDLLVNQVVYARDGDDLELGKGALGAMVELRDSTILSYKQNLDQLAGSFLWEFNRVHSQGTGLQGYSTITGSQSVVDPSVTLDQLAYGFTPVPGTFAIKNGNLELVVKNENTGDLTTLNVEIDLDKTGEPDTILYDPLTPAAPNSLVNKLQAALDSKFAGRFTVQVDTVGRLAINTIGNEYTFGFGRDTSGALAALGLNTFFSGNDAGSISVEQYLKDNPEMLACSNNFVSGNSDNSVSMLKLRETNILDNGTATADDYYQGIIGRMGIEFAQAKSLLETQEDILLRAENQREDLSGVNLDEELAKMMQFQRTFQSSARFISTADTLYETLISM